MQVTDTIRIGDATRKTADGYLVADARVARTGIQIYSGAEMGHPERKTMRVFRPEDEVFRKRSMDSYSRRPVTVGHPDQHVNSRSVRDVMVGITDSEVLRDGEFVRVPMMLMDQAAIDAFEAGVRELSMGYSCTIELQDGIAPSGEAYDAIMRDMKMNHLALVPQARGGSQLKLGDDGDPKKMTDIKTRTVLVDGITIETTDQGAQALEKLQKLIADAGAVHDKDVADAKASETAHAKELATRDAQIDDLKGKQTTAAALDALVTARVSLIDSARKVDADVVTDGKSADDIKKAVVLAKSGAQAVDGKSADYIAARFDLLVEAADGTDPVRKTIAGQPARPAPSGSRAVIDKAFQDSSEEMENAWQKPLN